jgi:hypothetical protein
MYLWGLRQLFGGGFSALALPRMEYWQTLQTGETWLYTFGAVFTLIGFYIALCGASRRQVGFVIAIVAIWGISNLWVGERSDPMIATVTVLWLLKKKGAVIAKKLFIAGVLAAILVIPMVGVMRGEVATRRLQAIDWAELTPVAALAEMGTTIGVLAESYRLVGPSQFRGGRTYVHAFRGVLPRKFFPDLARVETQQLELSPSQWFVWTTEPRFARAYGGRGFSSVAEAYINFGEVGVCLVFLALGFFFFRMESLAGRGAFSLAAYGIIFPPLVWTVRNDFSIVPRSVLWGLAFLAVVKLLSQAYRRPERVAKQAPAGGLLRASPSRIPRA